MTRSFPLASFALLFSLSLAACGDDAGSEASSGTGTETGDTGTSDEIGSEGSTTNGTSTSTTTTDETTTTTTDDGSCPVGSEGCPCTGGGGCDPGLVCEGGVCAMAAGTDTSTDTSTTDPTTDTTTTDTGMDPMPYQACPNGDADCAPGEICTMGAANMGQDPWTLCTPGECNGDDDCTVNDADICDNLPGDGQQVDFCVPSACDDQNPCPDANMICVFGFGGTGVCLWPN